VARLEDKEEEVGSFDLSRFSPLFATLYSRIMRLLKGIHKFWHLRRQTGVEE
jgi:hypothetical protein